MRSDAHRAWGLEALEPRVLLSADPVVSAVQAVLLPDLQDAALAGAYGADAPAPVDAAALVEAAQAADPGTPVVIGTPGEGQSFVFDRGAQTPVVAGGDLVLWADGAGGEVLIASPLIAPSIEIHGSGHTTTLTSDITAASGNVSISDSLRVDGARNITATVGSITLGANITHYLGGNSGATADTLVLSAAQNITVNGNIGDGSEGSDALSGLTISAAQNVTFQGSLVIDGDLIINATGIVTFNDQITLRNGGDLIVQGASQVFMRGQVQMQIGGAATPGVLTLAADEIDLSMSEELIQGTGAVTLRAATLATPIAVMSPAGAATNGVLNLESTEIRKFADGFSSITIGLAGGDGHAVAGAGAVSVGASAALDSLAFFDSTTVYGGTITVVDYTDRNAVLRLGTGDSLRLEAVGNISLVNEIEVDRLTLTSTTGAIAQTDVGGTADNRLNEALRTPDLIASAVTGVDLHSLEVQRVDVVNSGQGDITLGVNAARTTTRFAATTLTGDVDIVRVAQTAGTGGNDIALTTASGSIHLLAGAGISAAGTGGVALTAQGSGEDIALDAAISVTSGAVALSAADALTTGAAGSITASGAGNLTLTAGAGGITLLAPLSTQGGTIAMASGGVLDLSGVTLSGGTGGVVTLQSAGNLTVGIIDASASITLRSTGGALIDGLAGDAANLRSDTAAVVLAAANGVGTAAAPLRMLVASVEADNSSSGGVFIAEETALTITSGGLSTAGSAAGAGAIVVRTTSGALTVQGAVEALASGANGGHILLQTLGAGTGLDVAADIVSSTGSISLLAAQGLTLAGAGSPAAATVVRSAGSGQTLDLRAGGALTMAAAAQLITTNGAQRLEAAGAVTLGQADAGTATISVQAGGSITRAAGAAVRDDLVAAAIRLQAGGGAIGAANDALGLRTTTLAASATGGAVFLASAQATTLDSVAGAAVNRVASDGSASALSVDAAQAGLNGSSGVVLDLAAGALTVASGSGGVSAASGAVRLSTPGSIALAAAVSATAGAISVIAGEALSATDAADLTSGGSGGIDLDAGTTITLGAGTTAASAGGPIRLQAGGDVTLGQLHASAGPVTVAGATITGLASGTDITGGDLRLRATGSIGTGSDPLTLAVQRLAASAGGAGGLFLAEADDVVIAALPAHTGQRVAADGSLSTTPPEDAALAGLTSAGALVLQAGGSITADAGAAVQAAGALRLGATAGDLGLSAAVSSAGAPISLIAGRDLLLGEAVLASHAGATIDLEAGRDLTMAAAAQVQSSDGALALVAGNDLTVTALMAGTAHVALVAGGTVIDGDAGLDVEAAQLLVQGGLAVASGADALDIAVTQLAGSAGTGGFHVSEAQGLALGSVSVDVQRVAADGALAALPQRAADGLASAGGLVLAVAEGDLTIDAAVAAAGASRLSVAQGALALSAAVASGGGALSLVAAGAVTQGAASAVSSSGGDIELLAESLTMTDGATLASGGGDVRVATTGAVRVASLDAGSGAMSLVASALRDITGDAGTGPDLVAAQLRLQTLGTTSADGVGSSTDAIEIAAGRLAADVRGGGLFLAQTGALALDTLGPWATDRVQADGTVIAAADDAALAGLASAGALVLRADGSVQGASAAALTAGGALRVEAAGAAADLRLDGAVTVAAGHASLLAGRDLRLGGAVATTTAARTLDLEAGRDVLLDQGSVASTRNGALRVAAGGAITVESLDAGTAGLALLAGGRISDGDAAGDGELDLTAASLLLQGAGGVGAAGNSLETSAVTLAAQAAAGGLFLTEATALRIDAVSVTAQRVAADATNAALATATLEDLRTGDSAALTLVLTTGDLVVSGGAASPATAVDAAGGAVLLQTLTGKLSLDAGLAAQGGAVSLLAGADLALAAGGDVSTTGGASLDLQAGANMTQADGAQLTTGSGTVRLAAAGTMTLGSVQTAGDVSLLARSATDSGTTDLDIAARALRVVTTGSAAGQGLGTLTQAIDTQVSTLAASLAGIGAGGLFLREADGLAVDLVGPVAVDRVAADGSLSRSASTDAALADVVSQANLILVATQGDVALRDGNADGLVLQTVGNLLVDVRGGALTSDAAVRSTAGHVSLLASGHLTLGADVAVERSGRTLDLQAGGDLTTSATAVLSTANTDARLAAGGQLVIGQVDAGTGAVSLIATNGSITEAGSDAAPDVLAAQLRLNAGDGIGSAEERLETRVGVVTARAAAGGIWLQEDNGIQVNDVTVNVNRVTSAAGTTDVVDARQSDLVTTAGNGGVALRTVNGDIGLNDGTAPADGRSVSAHGSGVIALSAGGATAVLDATADDIRQEGPITLDSALRLQGTLSLTAGQGTGSGDGAITLQRAVDGNPGGAADTLALHADGPVVLQGAVGATTPLAGLRIDGATDVRFEQAVHLTGDLVIEADGVVEFLGPVTLDGTASLRIAGATRIVIAGVVQAAGGSLVLGGPAAGLTVGEDGGAGLVLDAATLARFQGFDRVTLGDEATGPATVSAATLAGIAATQIAVQVDGLTLQGSASFTDGTAVSLTSAGALTMGAADALISTGGSFSLQAADDVAVGLLQAATVQVGSSGGTVVDAADDLAINITADRFVMRGQGPALVAGASSTAAALDVQAPTLDVDAAQGVVLRDSLPEGGTRFNLLVGDQLFQQVDAVGAPVRQANGGDSETQTLSLTEGQRQAWLASLAPAEALRGSASAWADLRGSASSLSLAASPAAAQALADLRAAPLGGWLDSAQTLAAPAALARPVWAAALWLDEALTL